MTEFLRRDGGTLAYDVEGEGPVEDWVQVTTVVGELVTFESPTIFLADGERIDSTSTLRFRSQEALERSLSEAGFVETEVREHAGVELDGGPRAPCPITHLRSRHNRSTGAPGPMKTR